jgi:hypothetical protein
MKTKWRAAASLILASFLMAAPLPADTTCSDLSRDNPTLYRYDAGSMHCLDWDQATCSYVERPCRSGELGLLCYYIPVTCSLIGPSSSSRTVAMPAPRRKAVVSHSER